MKKTDRLATLDSAIQRETETVQSLETNLKRTREEKDKAEAEQQRLAYRALAEYDQQAQKQLEACEETLAKFNARVTSCEVALATARNKLDALREERQQAFIAEKRSEYAAQCVGLLKDDAEKLEKALSSMTEAREAIRARLQKMEAIGSQAGIDTTRAHNRIKENMRHCVEQRAQFESVWMSREVRETFKQPIAALLQATLKSLIPEIEGDEERRRA